MFGSVPLYPSSDHQRVFLLFTSVYCFVDVLHYIHLQDRQYVYYIFVIIIKIIKYKKTTRGLPWVKISKLCHNPIVHFPWEREGYLTAKNPSISVKIQYGLTVTKLHLSEFKSPTFSVKCSTA